MKKLFFAVFCLCLFFGRKAEAYQTGLWLSSNTAVNISTSSLCNTPSGTSYRAVLHGVCINTAAAGNVQVYNSSFSAINTITGSLSTATQEPCNYYDVVLPAGISYTKNGTADITILYSCY